jgi:hypothetical protein
MNKFFNIKHLLLDINNVQVQLNINTEELQPSLIIKKQNKPKKNKQTNKKRTKKQNETKNP